jgi:hypothetical protein
MMLDYSSHRGIDEEAEPLGGIPSRRLGTRDEGDCTTDYAI